MKRSNCFTPIFYVRGLNPPYTEGHIQIVNNMVRALLSQDIGSIIFNYRYNLIHSENHKAQKEERFEQTIPIVYREDVFHGGRHSILAYSSLMETLATLKFLSVEKNLISSGRYYVVNIVNAFRYPRILVKKLLKVPIVAHFYMRKAILKSLVKLVVDKADTIITSSQTVAHHLEKTYNISRKKTEIVYPPIDVNLYKPVDKNQVRKNLAISEDDKIILYMGNLRRNRFPEKKVLKTLRDLVETNFRTRLFILAPRNNENIRRSLEIKTEIEKLNLTANVKIKVEDLSENEKSLIYGVADIFLFPSLDPTTSTEPPLTVLEAMASGLPVISSNLSSMREIITDGSNGFLVAFNNEKSLTEKISSLLESDKIMRRFSSNARAYIVKEMSFVVSCKKLVQIYKRTFS